MKTGPFLTALLLVCCASLFGCGGNDNPPTAVQATDPPPVVSPPLDPPPVLPPVIPPLVEPPPSLPPVIDPPPVTPPPASVTLTFAGTFSCESPVQGTFSYLAQATIAGEDVRGLSPNMTYALTSWLFTADSRCDGLPSSTFKNGEPGQLAEFCVGICQFSDRVIQLRLTNQTDNVVMQLVWALPEHAQINHPPENLAAYGSFQQSLYRVPCPICSPVAPFHLGVLWETPASPPTL